MSQMTPIYYEVTPDFQLGKSYTQAELSPVFKEYKVAQVPENEAIFSIMRCASFFLNKDDLRRLLCVSKSLHAFLAEVKDQFNFRPPSQTVDLGVDASSFMHLLNPLKPHQFLLASEFRHEYIPDDDVQGREQTHLRSNFCFLSELNYDQFVDFSPLLQKAPFLQGLTLRLTDPKRLDQFLTAYPSLPFVKDLILCMTRLPDFVIATDFYENHIMSKDIYKGEKDLKYKAQSANNYFNLNFRVKRNQEVRELLGRCINLEKLIFRDDQFMPTDLEGLTPGSLPHLKLIEIDSGLMTTRVVHQLLRAAPNVGDLILGRELYWDDLFLNLQPNSLQNLRRIILPRDNSGDQHYTFADFGPANVQAIKAAAPNLQEMRTHHYNQPTPGSFTVYVPEPK